jgi:hypothetical protein
VDFAIGAEAGAAVAAVAWYDDTADAAGSLGRLVIAGVAAVAKYGDGPLV